MTTMAQVPSERHSAITREGYEQLCDELTALTTISRAQIGDRLRDAREQGGEFADNLELIDALEDQELPRAPDHDIGSCARRCTRS